MLGSTGSIGQSALAVIDASGGSLRAVALSAHSRMELLIEQARRFQPRWVIATDEQAASECDWSSLPTQTELLIGHEALERLVGRPEIDIVLAAIVGSAGLRSTWAAVEAGKDYSDEPTTLVVFELQEVPEGTLLTVTESGFDAIPPERRAAAFRDNEQGWMIQMQAIERHVGQAH